MLPTTSAQVAVFSTDGALCTRLLDYLQIERTCFADEFKDRIAYSSTDSPVAVIDWDTIGALRLCEDLSAHGKPRVVMIGVPDTMEAAIDALRAGAFGIVYKTQPLSDVSRAVDVVARGEVFAPRHVVLALWMRFRTDGARRPEPIEREGSKRLSCREREVLQYVAVGLSNRELATRLLISEATVKVHLTHIFQKLGVRRRAALAAAYFGIVQP
jgi:DNA-binding NarL/FixJ family response regulator